MIKIIGRLSIIALFLVTPVAIHAQGFSSGSTGADGALDISNCSNSGSYGANYCLVQVPESGILNYTTVNIPFGKVLRFKRNQRNTPVIMLAQGDVLIAGTIDVTAGDYTITDFGTVFDNRLPGPGGFYGGEVHKPGLGPGGGCVTCPGNWIGPLSLVPIIGGSGGGGDNGSWPGGGGGGAIVIASSTSITATGGIAATGRYSNGGGHGAGGAIRLVANNLNISGSFNATGGGFANPGVIRFEGSSVSFTGTSNPAAVLAPINSSIVSSSPPSLTIVSIAGVPVPSYAGARFNTIDLLLPNQLPDPIAVSVHASNIPLGTQVSLGFFGSATGNVSPGTLSGTFESSNATPTISNLNRQAVTYLLATAMFDPPASASHFNPPGPNHVARVKVEAKLGAKPSLVFLRKNGTVVEPAKLQKSFLALLGQ